MLGTRTILLDSRQGRVRIDVTSARAVSEFAGRVSGVRVLVLLVRPRLVVAAVAPRTIGLERRETPAYGFGIALVADRARKVAAMIERLVWQSCMTIVDRSPRVRVVATAAVLRRIEMARVLSGRRRAVVAGRAGAEHLVVIHRRNRRPHVGAVAVLADVGRLNVQRALPGRVSAVMAAGAVVDDVGVVEIRRDPGHGRVAVVAVVAAAYMSRMFARRGHAIMAGAAGADHLDMIHCEHGRPYIGGMAVLTNITRLDVCRPLACCVGPVMATDTVARDVDVVEIGGQPGDR